MEYPNIRHLSLISDKHLSSKLLVLPRKHRHSGLAVTDRVAVVNQLDNWNPLGHLNQVKVVRSFYAWMLVKHRKTVRANLLAAQTQKNREQIGLNRSLRYFFSVCPILLHKWNGTKLLTPQTGSANCLTKIQTN